MERCAGATERRKTIEKGNADQSNQGKMFGMLCRADNGSKALYYKKTVRYIPIEWDAGRKTKNVSTEDT